MAPIHRGERQRERALVGPQNPATAVLSRFREVVAAGAAEMGCEQGIRAQACIACQRDFDQNHVPFRIRRDTQTEFETLMFVNDLDCRNSRGRHPGPVIVQALDFDPEAFPVRDDKSQVANLRNICARVVNLVQDAVAGGEPEPSGSQSAANHVFGAACPGWGNSGMAEGMHGGHLHPALAGDVFQAFD